MSNKSENPSKRGIWIFLLLLSLLANGVLHFKYTEAQEIHENYVEEVARNREVLLNKIDSLKDANVKVPLKERIKRFSLFKGPEVVDTPATE
jgi:hypothetical protein